MSFLRFLEAKLFQKLVESTEDDMEKLHLANESFEHILDFIQKLGKNLEKFEQSFYKDDQGRLSGFSIEENLAKSKRKPEYANLFIQFHDHELSNVKKTFKAKASRLVDEETNKLVELHITLYIDVPTEAKRSYRKKYNKWIAENLEDVLQDPRYRSSFVHEFIHTLDFRRVDPSYLVLRTNRKKQEIETKIKKDLEKYINDPFELNAYYNQALSEMYNDLLKTETPEEWNALAGNSAQEFTDNLLNYLRPQAKKRLTPENIKRFMKRASTTWDYIRLT